MVGLVQHGDLDRVEVDVTLADEVLEPARAGDDDVDALGDGLDLGVLADAAEDRLGREPERLGQRGQRVVDLGGQARGSGPG